MIIVVESEKQDPMKAFAIDLVKELEKFRSSFHEIFYKVDTSYFKSRALLFMDFEGLEDLTQKLKEHQDFYKR